MLKYRKSGIKTLRFVFRFNNNDVITQVNAPVHISFTFLMSYLILIWSLIPFALELLPLAWSRYRGSNSNAGKMDQTWSKYDIYARKTETSVFICGSFINRYARSHFYVQFVFYWRLCHCPWLTNLSVINIIRGSHPRLSLICWSCPYFYGMGQLLHCVDKIGIEEFQLLLCLHTLTLSYITSQ